MGVSGCTSPFLLFLIGKNSHGIGKRVAYFHWEWGLIYPLEKGRKSPAKSTIIIRGCLIMASTVTLNNLNILNNIMLILKCYKFYCTCMCLCLCSGVLF